MNQLDDFVSEFSRRLTSGRVESLLRALLVRKAVHGLSIDAPMWEALYTHTVSRYAGTRYVCGVPATFVTKHNQIVPFYTRHLSSQLSPTVPILHFDTHSDLNRIDGGERITRRNAASMVWDIGAAVSGVLTSTGVRNVVWCMPSWVPDDQQRIPYIFHRKKNELQTTERIRDVDFTHVKSFPEEYTVAQYTKLRTGAMSVRKACRKLREVIEPNRRFILDVDLDYFVCNGKKYRPSYFRDPIDLRSYHRTRNFSMMNEDNPRNRRDNNNNKNRQLDREVKHIDRRIRHFLSLMRCLFKRGFRPCLVSVSDSSNVLGADCKTCNSESNGYVPTYLALYVHVQVVYGLNRLIRDYARD